jgi:hypothetical protein
VQAPAPSPRPRPDSRRAGSRPHRVTRLGGLLALALILGFALSYLTLRILAGPDGAVGASGRALLLAAVISAGAAVWAARGGTPERDMSAWWIVAGGCTIWAAGHLSRTSVEPAGQLVFNLCYLVMMAALVGGAIVIGEFLHGIGSWRAVLLDLTPPVIALLVTSWLVTVGSFVTTAGLGERLQLIAMLHGIGAVTAIVVGIAGFLSHCRQKDNPPARSLLAGLAAIAVGDLFWLQHWTDRPAGLSTAADVCFCIGFVTIAVAALQARIALGRRPMRLSEVPPRLTLQPAGYSLLLLLLLAGVQTIWGELAPYGVETAIGGCFAVVLFALLREGITARRERQLTSEVGALTNNRGCHGPERRRREIVGWESPVLSIRGPPALRVALEQHLKIDGAAGHYGVESLDDVWRRDTIPVRDARPGHRTDSRLGTGKVGGRPLISVQVIIDQAPVVQDERPI